MQDKKMQDYVENIIMDMVEVNKQGGTQGTAILH